MKRDDREFDSFEQLLRDSLASDAVPADDFTARLMEQVRRTPQQRAKKQPRTMKVLAALAACLVIAVAIPLAMPKGSAKSSDMADMDMAPEAAMQDTNGQSGEGALFAAGSDTGRQYEEENAEYAVGIGEPRQKSDACETVTLAGQDAENARQVLESMGIAPLEDDMDIPHGDGALVYELTAEQTALLGEVIDALYGAEDGIILILEVDA